MSRSRLHEHGMQALAQPVCDWRGGGGVELDSAVAGRNLGCLLEEQRDDILGAIEAVEEKRKDDPGRVVYLVRMQNSGERKWLRAQDFPKAAEPLLTRARQAPRDGVAGLGLLPPQLDLRYITSRPDIRLQPGLSDH